jgi:hypothetical protein
MIHPDSGRSYTVLAVVAMDLSGISLHAVPGTVEPRDSSLSPDKRPGRVPDSEASSLLAAFNGGFLTIHGYYGMMVDGHRLLDPQPTSCTLAIYRDSTIRIRTWTEIATTESEMTAFRQTPLCLAESGKLNSALANEYNTHWGAAVGGNTVLRRSAVGISEDGKVLYFGMGDSLTARSLAEGMLAAGAHDVAQLDVNHAFPRFVFFGKSSSGAVSAVAPLCPGFNFDPSDYVSTPMRRDFFYVTRRAPAST